MQQNGVMKHSAARCISTRLISSHVHDLMQDDSIPLSLKKKRFYFAVTRSVLTFQLAPQPHVFVGTVITSRKIAVLKYILLRYIPRIVNNGCSAVEQKSMGTAQEQGVQGLPTQVGADKRSLEWAM